MESRGNNETETDAELVELTEIEKEFAVAFLQTNVAFVFGT